MKRWQIVTLVTACTAVVVAAPLSVLAYYNSASANGLPQASVTREVPPPISPIPEPTLTLAPAPSGIPDDPCAEGYCPPDDDPPSPTQPPVAPEVPEGAARVSFYEGLSLVLGEAWDVESQSGVKTANDTSHCNAPGRCANFSVWGPAIDGRDWTAVVQPARQCSSDLSAATGPVTSRTVSIGGREATYYEVPLCRSGSETLLVWDVQQPRVMITTIQGRGRDVDIDPILATARWE